MTRDPGSARDLEAPPLDDATAAEGAAASLVAFFEGLGGRARAELERLAEADRKYGEDVAAELREKRPQDQGAS